MRRDEEQKKKEGGILSPGMNGTTLHMMSVLSIPSVFHAAWIGSGGCASGVPADAYCCTAMKVMAWLFLLVLSLCGICFSGAAKNILFTRILFLHKGGAFETKNFRSNMREGRKNIDNGITIFLHCARTRASSASQRHRGAVTKPMVAHDWEYVTGKHKYLDMTSGPQKKK